MNGRMQKILGGLDEEIFLNQIVLIAVLIIIINHAYTQREGTMGLLLHYSPKFNNNVFLFVAYYLILNGWFIKLSVQTFQPLISYTISQFCVSSLEMYVNLSSIVLSL